MKKLIPYIVLTLFGAIFFNAWFFMTTYRTARYWKERPPKEIIITKYTEGECVCPESEKSWIDIPAVAK